MNLSLYMRFVPVLIALNCVSVAHAFQDSDKANLAWKFAQGDALTVQFEQTQKVLTRIDVRDRILESELLLVVDWKVASVGGDGNATVDQVIKRIRIKTGTPGEATKGIVDLDTGSDEKLRGVSRDVMKQMQTLVGLEFSIVMTPLGEIVSVTPDEGVATVVAALPETSALRRVFSAANMSKLLKDSAFALPAEPVGKGDSWTDDSKITIAANDGNKLPFDRSVKSTVASLDADKANIDVAVSLAQKKTTAAPPDTALTSPLDMQSFTGSGNIVFDRSTGTVTSSKMATELKTVVIYRTDKVKTTTTVANKMTVTRK